MVRVKRGQVLAFLVYLVRHAGVQEIHVRQFLPIIASHVDQNKSQGLYNDLRGSIDAIVSTFLHSHFCPSLSPVTLLIIHPILAIPASMLLLTHARTVLLEMLFLQIFPGPCSKVTFSAFPDHHI